ncbi:MAG: DUF1993 domain-containing protein [Myxococcales bacterium]|nr:DUF1993 domain-containing protein [Myxococcales bacterium]
MYAHLNNQFKKTLGQMDIWLARATEYAEGKKFDPNVFVTMRLAPDQLPFAKQVQIACDTAKLGVSRLTGKPAPEHPDTETTIAELGARVKSVIGYLNDFKPADFANAATAVITQPRWEGKVMTGADYMVEYVLPNFFFHASHTYAILRHNGVPLGKKDYLGALSQRQP